jgi:thioredoxin-like negative regulator of GroEL
MTITSARPPRAFAPLVISAGLGALCLLVSSASVARAEGVTWQPLTVDEALARAEASSTLVLIDVYATWCGPCQRLDDEVFPTAVVGGATSDLVALRIDAEADEGPAVVERFHVVGYPTVLLLRADGTEIDRVFGFMPAEELASTVTGYREGRGTIDELRSRVAAAPDELELVLELGFRSAVRGEYSEATPLLERVIAEDPDNARGLRVQAHYVLGKFMFLRGQANYAAALEQFELLTTLFPDTGEAAEAPIQAAIAHARAGDEAAASAALERVLARAPADSATYNTVAWACFRENFQLERGIAIAERGLALNPADHSLWDTLAELQFASGDREGALRSIAQAAELAPEVAYYQRQLERFSRADRTN